MASKKTKRHNGLNLTQEEPESHGVVFPKDPVPISVDMGEHPLHKQIGGSLTEDDVTETLTGEVAPENRGEVDDLFADLQEEEAGRQAD
jgi:hypothetical protein